MGWREKVEKEIGRRTLGNTTDLEIHDRTWYSYVQSRIPTVLTLGLPRVQGLLGRFVLRVWSSG